MTGFRPFGGFSKQFMSLIQARHGRSGKWSRAGNYYSNKSAGKGGSGSSGLGGFGGDGFNGGKPRASSELFFFSSGKSFASYPLDHQSMSINRNPTMEALKNIMTPSEIKEYLDKHVIGQEHAKKVIAVAVYNHYCRLRSIMKNRFFDTQTDFSTGFDSQPLSNNSTASGIIDTDEITPEKSNILLIGPSGSGKTLIAKTVSRLLKVPFAMGDATSLTEAGYVGEDVDSLLYRLLEKAKFDSSIAQSGIVFLDEVDKIARSGGGVKGSTNTGGGRDVGGEGVQHALLKMLEGTVVQVVDRRKPGREFISFDTSNLLFILSGAFVGLEGIVGARSAVSSIGFGGKEEAGEKDGEGETTKLMTASPAIVGKNSSNWMEGLQTGDIINYGLIPEFIGRVPVVAVLEELDERALIRTLTEPKNSLVKQYQHLFKMNNVDLVFEEDALMAIGRISIESKTGARGLRGIMEKLLLPLMYDIPSKKNISKVIIHKEFVEGKVPAKFEYTKSELSKH